MTEAEQVERVALAIWVDPYPGLPGETGSPERWRACQAEARATLADQQHWAETGEVW